MDTKLKKFKQSATNKLLCVVMAIVLITSFVCSFLPCSAYINYIGIENSLLKQQDELRITDTYWFASNFTNDVENIIWIINDQNPDGDYYDSDYILEDMKEYKNFHFYAKNTDGTVITNVDNPKEFVANIEQQDYVIIDKKDIIISDSLSGYHYLYEPADNTAQIYVAVDMHTLVDGDPYGQMAKMISDLQGYSFHTSAIVCITSFLFLIILFAYALTCTGKVTKLDKLFNDIRFYLFLACEVGLGFCAVFIVVIFNERIYDNVSNYSIVERFVYSNALIVAGVLAVCLFCFIFYGFVASQVRQGKNGINTFKNTLVYKLGSLPVKGAKKVAGSVKNLLSYKIDNFNKQIILWVLLYAVFNFGCLFVVFLGCIWYAWLLVFFAIMVMVAGNVACLIFVVQYIINLDKIITAMHNRTTPDVNYAKLPNSLKILVDSMQYTQDELNKAVNKAIKDERLRTELITNVSHDLKTPLTSIINYVDLLSKCDIDGEQEREYISVLTDKSQKLKHLVDDLVEASKITSGVVTINPVYLNLNELVMQAVVDAQKDFENANLQIIIKNENNNVTAFVDGNKTHRIVDNLLTNARKYSAMGSRVYIDMYYEGGFSVFEIKNMSAQPLDISADELTERFVRGDKSRSQDGNGLGLSIAKNLCLAQHGDLKIIIDGDLFKAKVYLPTK